MCNKIWIYVLYNMDLFLPQNDDVSNKIVDSYLGFR